MSTAAVQQSRTHDLELRRRALAVIPNGMYGHLNTRLLGAEYPQFLARGEGARVWDVDGREFIDLMCTFGPILLGHAHPEVDATAAQASARGDVLNGPGSEMVELAELLVDRVPHADWAMFAKNGTDVTGLALTTARAKTGRRKVLMARNSYHGIDPWSLVPESPGTTPEDHANTVFFDYNDLDSLEGAVIEATEGDVAAIICTPHRHDVFTDQVLAEPEFARGVREICNRIGAALILDDVRCGLRIDVRGSWERYGVRPDLSAWSKSLANGYAIAALLGGEDYRGAAGRVTATGSFWLTGAPIAAALTTIRILEETDGIATMRASGRRLQDGLVAQAHAHGLEVTVSGPPQMPLLLFAGDPEFAKAKAWAGACATNGVWLHPVHNWFISTAHDEATIDAALQRTDAAFAFVVESFGGD